MSWSSRKKEEGIFCTNYFVRMKFFNIYVLSQCILYRIHFQNIHTFTYQKTLLHALFLYVFKIFESLQCILKCDVLTKHRCTTVWTLFWIHFCLFKIQQRFRRNSLTHSFTEPNLLVHSLVVSNLCLEKKGSRFKSSYQLGAEVSSLQ